MTPAQSAERAKYREIYAQASGQRPYGSTNHSKPAVGRLFNLGIKSLIDVGCGNGKFCRWSQATGVEVFALDFASAPGLPSSIAFSSAPTWNIPLPDGTVEYVTAFDVLEHLLREDIAPTLREFRRVSTVGMILSISYRESNARALDGSSLHPTIEPREWWLETIEHTVGGEVEEWPELHGGFIHWRWRRPRPVAR